MSSLRHVSVGDLVEICDDRPIMPSMLSRMKAKYGLGLVTRIYETFFFDTEKQNPDSIEYGVIYFYSVNKSITLSLRNVRRVY
jgi:hypothetical protein